MTRPNQIATAAPSTGRKCDGYFDCVVSPRSDTSACSPQAALAFHPSSTSLEKKTFEWFRYQTVPILSGHFPDETYNRTTLQLYFSEPAVRYTVSAFGALHQEIFSTRMARNAGMESNLRTHLPAEQYSRALREMQTLLALSDVPLEVILVCSVLLVQFEGLQQSFLPAMLHAEKALSLLSAAVGEKRIEESLLRTMIAVRCAECDARWSESTAVGRLRFESRSDSAACVEQCCGSEISGYDVVQ